jgi:ABC-type Mn2+/Zn2+ transport system ATPase subunit
MYFRITLRNYRSFDDTAPVTIEVGPGFTALVGPNNAGKSSFLKFFFEARPLFTKIAFVGEGLAQLFGEHGLYHVDFQGVDAYAEVYTNRNSRSLSIEIEFFNAGEEQISRIVLQREREYVEAWLPRVFIGPEQKEVRLQVVDNSKPMVVEADGSLSPIDLMPLYRATGWIHRMVYVGPYRNASSEGGGKYYDLDVGTSFIERWDEWKTGKSRETSGRIQRVTEDIARIFGFRRFEISAAENRTVLQVIIDGKPYRLRELGAGLAQFIMVLANVAIKEPSFLLIDEPELNLHPSLQVDFLTTAASYAKEGVIFATHSIGLARTTAERIYSFQKPQNSTLVRPFEQTLNFAEFMGEMSFSAFRELGHDTILLVEGVTEVRAVQQFLRLLKVDHRIALLPLGGAQFIRGGVELELAELQRLTQHVAVLIDSEKDGPEAELGADRRAFVESCTKLGFQVHVTDFRAFENYLPEAAIQEVKSSKYRALLPYERLKDVPFQWGKHENWRIAREMTLDDLLRTDVGRFLQTIVVQEANSSDNPV